MNNIYSIEMNIYVYGLCWDLYAKTIHLEKKIQRPLCTAFVKTELVASELYKSIIYVHFLFSRHKL
jgi:hypothetical protein